VLIPLVLVFALLFPDLDSPPKYKAWIQDHEVWIDTSAGPRRVIYDALAADPVAASPSGDKVAYAVPDGKRVPEGLRPSMLVVVMSAEGRSPAKFTPEEDSVFDVIEWIDNERIGVWYCGHANCVYWVVDANSGKALHKFFGGFDFLWSHDRRYVARRGVGPVRIAGKDGMIDTDDFSFLMLNADGKDIYPPLNPDTHHPYDRVLGYLSWSPNDEWISFPETEYPSGDGYVVLVSPEGEVLRESLPVDVEYDAKIEWTDDSHFQITTSKQTFKFVVDGGKLHEIVQHAK
jgi:hypothetical protein